MMNGMDGWMGWGMGFGSLLVLIVLILAIAALVKISDLKAGALAYCVGSALTPDELSDFFGCSKDDGRKVPDHASLRNGWRALRRAVLA